MNVVKHGETEQGTSLRTMLVAVGLALFFLAWGLFLFTAIGDKGMPSWSFGALDDVPGLSPYSTAGPQEVPSLVPSAGRSAGQTRGQHVMGPQNREFKHRGGTP